MIENLHVLKLLKDLDSQVSQNKLIEISSKIAIGYLRFNYKKVYKFLQNEELTIEELAINAIASLFVREKKENNISIHNSFINWSPTINNDEDALFFLNKIVASRVEQHLYSLLRDEDPFFSKLLDSVNYLIKSQGFNKIQSYGKTYIVKIGYEVCSNNFIDYQGFENIPAHIFYDKQNLIKKLLDYLEKETKFELAIPINELILKLKHINFSKFAEIESSEKTWNQFEMNEIVDLAFKSTVNKLSSFYNVKGKLDESEVISLRSALTDICEDLMNGGITPGLYNYLAPHMTNLSKDYYREHYHNILEYLLKVIKNAIANNLTDKN